MGNPAAPRYDVQPLLELYDGNLEAAVGGWLQRLAEVVYLELPWLPPGERAKRAEEARAKEADTCPERRRRRRGRKQREERRERNLYWRWAAELYEAPELAERVVAVLPAEVVSDFESLEEPFRSPNPLSLRVPEEWWRCDNCGAGFDEGDEQAVIVTGQAGFSDLPEDLHYCVGCVVEVVDQRGGAGSVPTPPRR